MGGTTDVTTLLERSEPLAMLRDVLDASRTSGQLVTVCGEAGIGKSSLLRAFADRESSGAGVLWGVCEALGTPRPLGPLLDIAGSLEGRTGDTLASGSPRHEVFAAVVEDLTRRTSPVVIVFEDVHWADAATFDLLQYLGRRIRPARAMVVVTWRDDEVSADHAIHRVVGEWPHASVHRLRLLPLSLAAVQTLADGGQDARAVHALTGGNPFFVAEVLERGRRRRAGERTRSGAGATCATRPVSARGDRPGLGHPVPRGAVAGGGRLRGRGRRSGGLRERRSAAQRRADRVVPARARAARGGRRAVVAAGGSIVISGCSMH